MPISCQQCFVIAGFILQAVTFAVLISAVFTPNDYATEVLGGVGITTTLVSCFMFGSTFFGSQGYFKMSQKIGHYSGSNTACYIVVYIIFFILPSSLLTVSCFHEVDLSSVADPKDLVTKPHELVAAIGVGLSAGSFPLLCLKAKQMFCVMKQPHEEGAAKDDKSLNLILEASEHPPMPREGGVVSNTAPSPQTSVRHKSQDRNCDASMQENTHSSRRDPSRCKPDAEAAAKVDTSGILALDTRQHQPMLPDGSEVNSPTQVSARANCREYPESTASTNGWTKIFQPATPVGEGKDLSSTSNSPSKRSDAQFSCVPSTPGSFREHLHYADESILPSQTRTPVKQLKPPLVPVGEPIFWNTTGVPLWRDGYIRRRLILSESLGVAT